MTLIALSFPRFRQLTIGRLQTARYLPRIRLKKTDRQTLDLLGANGSLLGAGIISILIGIILLINPYG